MAPSSPPPAFFLKILAARLQVYILQTGYKNVLR